MELMHYQCALVSSKGGVILKVHHWFLLLAGWIFKSSSNSIRRGMSPYHWTDGQVYPSHYSCSVYLPSAPALRRQMRRPG